MNRFRRFVKKHRDVINLSGMLLGLVLVLGLVHIAGLYYISDAEIEHDMQKEAAVTSNMMMVKMSSVGSTAVQAAYELSSVMTEGTPEKGMMTRILYAFANNGQFEECYYLTKGGELSTESGQIIPWSGRNSSVRGEFPVEYGNYRFFTGFELGSSRIYAVAPVVYAGETVGYFLGGCTFTDDMRNVLFRYRELDDVMYLTDVDGDVLMQRNRSDEPELSGLVNLYSYFEGEIAQENYAALLKRDLADRVSGSERLHLSQGEYALVFQEVPYTDGWNIVVLEPKRVFVTELIAQRRPETTLMLFDILLVIFVVLCIFVHTIRKRKELERTLCYDELTHTMTKEFFRKTGSEMLAESGIPYNVAVVDLVGFRYINELFGHERGNEIIRVMAQLLSENLGSMEIVARNNADCFEMMVADPEAFKINIAKTSEALKAFAQNIDVTYPILIRAGIVSSSKNKKDLTELLDKANAARKSVHPQKGTLVAEYSGTIQGDIKMREEIEASMETAMEHGEFRVFLQPKMDIRENKLAGAEALVRWIRRDGTMVYPDQFMPIFETNGFVEKLDFFMLEEVCRLLKRLGDEGYDRVPISVNQSQMLLMNPSYVSKVMNVLDRYSIPRRLVELELTETAFFGDKDRMIDIMKQLREQNCIIDIDDFGSGYSSLNMIKDIPFDILKIDRMFFSDSNSGTGRIILEKVVEMAHAMNVDCICEGVETAEQEQLLREIGCRYAQGYYYSRPIPAEDFVIKFMTRSRGGKDENNDSEQQP